MNIIYLILFFVLGVIMGEFFVTVGIRLADEDVEFFSKNHCDKCFHNLTKFETIPIFSYIFLKGKCRYCHNKININNPLMELFTGILFAVSYYSFGISYNLLIALGIVSLLVIITVSDINYLIIPDEVLVFFSIYFMIVQYLGYGIVELAEHIGSGILLFSIMYLIMLFGNKVFKKESLGGGDIKLMFVFGLVLNPLIGILTIFIGSLIALPISFISLYKTKDKLIPFGPFLVLAFTLVYFLQIDNMMIFKFLGLY